MNFPLSSYLRHQYWCNWLDEEIFYMNDYIPRQEIIMIFVTEDLVPFIKNKGYEFGVEEKHLAQIIARELFHSLCNKVKTHKWHSNGPNKRYRIEDYDHFNFIFDSYVWQDFWGRTDKWIDIEENITTRTIIEFAVWTCIDLGASQQTSIVNEMLNGSDSDTDSDLDEREREREREIYNED
jgi:hypothetical protein